MGRKATSPASAPRSPVWLASRSSSSATARSAWVSSAARDARERLADARVGEAVPDARVAGRGLDVVPGALVGPAHERALDAAVLVAEGDLEVQHVLAVALEAEVAGLDDARVHGADRHLVDLPPADAEEVRDADLGHGSAAAGRHAVRLLEAHRLQPGVLVGHERPTARGPRARSGASAGTPASATGSRRGRSSPRAAASARRPARRRRRAASHRGSRASSGSSGRPKNATMRPPEASACRMASKNDGGLPSRHGLERRAPRRSRSRAHSFTAGPPRRAWAPGRSRSAPRRRSGPPPAAAARAPSRRAGPAAARRAPPSSPPVCRGAGVSSARAQARRMVCRIMPTKATASPASRVASASHAPASNAAFRISSSERNEAAGAAPARARKLPTRPTPQSGETRKAPDSRVMAWLPQRLAQAADGEEGQALGERVIEAVEERGRDAQRAETEAEGDRGPCARRCSRRAAAWRRAGTG